MDLISVIIPFFKGKEWLINAIESVKNQTYQEYEIIVVDDGSGIAIDDLKDLFSKVQIIHKENGGPASARNRGIEAANGKYVAFLDSDDIWNENKLLHQIEFMKNNNYRWSATSYTKFLDGQENNPTRDIEMNLREVSDMSLWQMFSSTRIATPTVMIEKEFLEENRDLRFVENLRFAEDTCFWFAMAMKSNFGFIDLPLARVRIHGSNAAGNCVTQIFARSDIFDFIKKRNKEIVEKMPWLLRFGYAITQKEKKLLMKLQGRKLRHIDKLAKVIYSVPWAIFQFSSFVYGGK